MAAGLFDDLDAQIQAERTEKKTGTIKNKEKNQDESQKSMPMTPTKEDTPQKKVGRPRSRSTREAFTIKPKIETKRAIKIFAADHGITSSDVIDMLTEEFLEELETRRLWR